MTEHNHDANIQLLTRICVGLDNGEVLLEMPYYLQVWWKKYAREYYDACEARKQALVFKYNMTFSEEERKILGFK